LKKCCILEGWLNGGSMKKKQPEKTEQTKLSLLSSFCRLYSKKPIEKISVLEITRKAGYNRSTFYQYFSDIYEMLDCVENDVLGYLQRKSPKEKNPEINPPVIHEVVNLYEEKGEYLNALMGKYGSNRFLERLKEKIPLDGHELSFSDNNPVTPYLIEFHRSTALSLFQFWQLCLLRRKWPPSLFASVVHCNIYAGVV
jgi:AcrR family transcriptional regulator